MIRKIACLVTIGLIFSGITVLGADSKKEAAALSAAEKWLAMVDSEKYAESWKQRGKVFILDRFRHNVKNKDLTPWVFQHRLKFIPNVQSQWNDHQFMLFFFLMIQSRYKSIGFAI